MFFLKTKARLQESVDQLRDEVHGLHESIKKLESNAMSMCPHEFDYLNAEYWPSFRYTSDLQYEVKCKTCGYANILNLDEVTKGSISQHEKEIKEKKETLKKIKENKK